MMISKPHIITIDGPSASGKGTIATEIAHQLQFNYLDSGAIYRLTAYIARHELKINTQAESYETEDYTKHSEYTQDMCIEIMHAFKQANIQFAKTAILFNGQNIAPILRQENMGNEASKLAAIPYIRENLLHWQRHFSTLNSHGLVTDGRDMGTIVFPHATCKIFLIADVEKRAQRRYIQLQEKITYAQILQDLQQRDARDIQRKHAPLIPAADAYIIDNTSLSISETVAVILDVYQRKLAD
jgi:CMP/dCMP kinase